MRMLEAFDPDVSFLDAGELAGCSQRTVAVHVAKRDAGWSPGEGPVRRERIIDARMVTIEEWVERAAGKGVTPLTR